MQFGIRTEKQRQIIDFFAWFLVYFVMLLGVLNRSPGFTDEADNFIGGMVIASGGSIYKDFVSQHMPVMYYICALFKILGADSVYTFRFLFYLLLAFLWAAVAVGYKKEFGSIASAGVGIFYITNMFSFYTCCILAEQIQGICFVVLLMEFLLFVQKKKIERKSYVIISAAIFFSFGSAFVSIFPIFAIALAFLAVEILECYQKKQGVWGSIKKIWETFWRLICAVLVPFFFLFLVYLVKGTFSLFLYSAYTINREIYPNYIEGYGSSILLSFVEPVINYAKAVFDGVKSLFLEVSVSKQYLAILRQVIGYGVNVFFWLFYAKKRNGIFAVLIAYFTMMCGQRGFTHEFHALPYVAVTMFMAAFLIQNYVNYLKKTYGKTQKLTYQHKIGVLAILALIFSYTLQYAGAYRSITMTIDNLTYRAKDDTEHMAYWIHKLTLDGELVLLTTTEPQLLVEADRTPFVTGISVPWMYEAFEEREMAQLEENPPRVAVYSSSYRIWGHAVTDYAPEFTAYMEQNYTLLNEERFPKLYIRNDYLEEALQIYKNEN